MSAINPTIALLYAQTTHAAKLANESVAALATQPEMSKLLAAETAKQEKHLVQEVQKGEALGKLGDDASPGRDGRRFGSRRRQRAKPPHEVEETRAPPDALLGNLLDLKI
ncbi:MAG: hypothetical protein LBH94_03640 [Deltaproteobacteria bacterium]|jgi:hypothetical protein|nr:hypothetical protein [Deltaproteobacteria bacterium]